MIVARPCAVAVALALSAGTAGAETAALMDRCFTRVYDSAHLDKHPGQEVVRMTADFVGFEDDVVARLRFVTRPGGHVFVASGECADDDGGLACHVCAGDAACEWTDETFRIKVVDEARITVVNDTTGITAADLGADGAVTGTRTTLTAGGESGAFLLSEAPATECGR